MLGVLRGDDGSSCLLLGSVPVASIVAGFVPTTELVSASGLAVSLRVRRRVAGRDRRPTSVTLRMLILWTTTRMADLFEYTRASTLLETGFQNSQVLASFDVLRHKSTRQSFQEWSPAQSPTCAETFSSSLLVSRSSLGMDTFIVNSRVPHPPLHLQKPALSGLALSLFLSAT